MIFGVGTASVRSIWITASKTATVVPSGPDSRCSSSWMIIDGCRNVVFEAEQLAASGLNWRRANLSTVAKQDRRRLLVEDLVDDRYGEFVVELAASSRCSG